MLILAIHSTYLVSSVDGTGLGNVIYCCSLTNYMDLRGRGGRGGIKRFDSFICLPSKTGVYIQATGCDRIYYR